jgi:ketosteroid isomerase-like protein
MRTQQNVEIVKNFLAALGRRDKQGLLALSADAIEWIIPGEDWSLAGTHRGRAGLERIYCGKLTRRWKLPFRSRPSS